MTLVLDIDTQAQEVLRASELLTLTRSFAQVFPVLNQKSYLIEVIFVSLTDMQKLNREQRSKDKPTDVLSFPLFQGQEDWESFAIPTDISLGTIIICPEYAADQGTPLLDLLHHGIVHILGFDHESDETQWRSIERAIVKSAADEGLIIHGIPD